MTVRRTLVLIAAAALALRLLLLFVRGDYLVYDEGYYLLLARSLRAGHGFRLGGLPHVALSPLQPMLVAGLSSLGVNDLWASRLLGATCGSLLALPVAFLAGRWFGQRGAIGAALFVAVFPSLVTYLPFFPGHGWNLYFGSEPLFLLLGMTALAATVHAAEGARATWWVLAGACAALAYCTRLEGIVLAAMLGVATIGVMVWRRRLALWPRAMLAVAAGVIVALPYLLYLHGALGRWALSGRVQAAATEEPAGLAAAATATPAHGGSSTVSSFVWGGDQEALWRVLYALDASGTRMASQYWGVAPRPATPNVATSPPTATLVADSLRTSAADRPPAGGTLATLRRGVSLVVPFWVLLLAFAGFVATRSQVEIAIWLGALLVTALIPALLAYPEPRALLILVPAACILAGGAAARAGDLVERRTGKPPAGWLPTVFAVLALLVPTAGDVARAWNQDTPLQQLAAARRVVGQYLKAHVAPGARIVSWHPAIALYAGAEWRVLPYDTFERIVGYARAQRASVIVFSRFEPSPLQNPPRAFTVVLLDTAPASAGGPVRLDPVDQTPLVFVGRLAATP